MSLFYAIERKEIFPENGFHTYPPIRQLMLGYFSLATLNHHIFQLIHARAGQAHYCHQLNPEMMILFLDAQFCRSDCKADYFMRIEQYVALKQLSSLTSKSCLVKTAFGDFCCLLSSFSASDSLAICVGTTKSSFEISIVSALPVIEGKDTGSGDPGVEPLMRNEFDDDPFPSMILKSLKNTAFTKEKLNYIDRSLFNTLQASLRLTFTDITCFKQNFEMKTALEYELLHYAQLHNVCTVMQYAQLSVMLNVAKT
ncbi:hypothetical protein T4D_13667 [Trichinella pseudospiralis]|uniref:Uncharacterized protein n=1 Tax=Trichinella pseudospiralis TaxID=6337 RepID=A0A0V1FYT8_TRIPS|nr:hypothetical protein T4D_13667 [Trichinella pseudospiralis]